jgi:hypothetical protein
MANVDGYVKTHSSECIKQYIEYDGSDRMEYVYEARANAQDGEKCLKTQYVYDGATTRITKMKETETTWDSSWDIS